MKTANETPKTLMEAIRYFARPGVAQEYVTRLRWPDGPVCEKCGLTGDDIYFMANVQRFKCRGCKNQFSVKRGTIMEDSPIALDKWLCAIWMIANCRNGVSSYEIARALGITQKSAWFMMHRIREAMKTGIFGNNDPLKGTVEGDETFIGPKVGMMNRKSRRKIGKVIARQGKIPVAALVERGGRVRAEVLDNVQKSSLLPFILWNVEMESKLYTDKWRSYRTKEIKACYKHDTVNHLAEEYVRGDVHTNNVENFWSLLKRSLGGTYISVEPFHLFRYVEEQVFRFNARKDTDRNRFDSLLGMLSGKRLTYAALTGGMEPQTC